MGMCYVLLLVNFFSARNCLCYKNVIHWPLLTQSHIELSDLLLLLLFYPFYTAATSGRWRAWGVIDRLCYSYLVVSCSGWCRKISEHNNQNVSGGITNKLYPPLMNEFSFWNSTPLRPTRI